MQTRLGLMVLMVCGVLSLLVGTASPRPADDAYRRGLDAYNRQDYATALREWQPLAQQGYPPAQTFLGVMYAQGQGVAQNDAEAVKWYRKAADQGLPAAQFALGTMYEWGKGVAQNDAEAVKWYRKAADQGLPAAQFTLGTMYEAGQGVAQNDAEAVKWYRKAADQGLLNSQFNLGHMYDRGKGVAQDKAEAVKWYCKAADQSHPTAQYNLGGMYDRGEGVAQNLVEAHGWFARAAETLPLGTDRDNAVQARERIARQLATAQPPTPASVPRPPASAPAAQPPNRRALVIGNAAYPDSSLANPVNDATDIATLLRRLGFDVTLHTNANRSTMEKAVDLFTRGGSRGSAGLFFFAGHGVQIDGGNYLLPIGAPLDADSDIKYHAVRAEWVLDRMDESGMEVKLMFLDACRNKPLGRSATRGLNRGLAVMETPQGALIAYATSPGKTAADGTGRNSPFTAQLLRELVIPGRDIDVVLKAVRAGVQHITNNGQIPWVHSSMTGDFYIAR